MLGKPCEIKEVPNRRVWQLGLGATVQEQGVHFKVWAPKRRRVAEWTGISMAGQVVYELHVGTFTPEGTFNAAARELDELRRLGVTLVELMPVAEFPGRWNWGYDGVDLYASAHVYGDPEALKRFVDAAHAHGLSVILDVVYNHLGPDGNYLSAQGCRKHRLEYRKRTEIAVEIVHQLEAEGQFPQAHYAFDNGVLRLELTRLIEGRGKQ